MKPSVSILAALLVFCSATAGGASIDTARAFYNKGDFNSALQQVKQLLASKPASADALFLKAQLQNEAGEKDQAIATYKTLIKHHPGQLAAYNNLATIYAQRDNLQAASEVLEKALHIDPIYAALYDNLRAVYWDMSRKHARAALRLTPATSSAKPAQLSTSMLDTQTATVSQVDIQQAEPTATTTQAKEDPKHKSSDEQRVEAAINRWSKAWSERNAANYVAAYTENYRPSASTRSDWIAARRRSFKSKEFIKLKIDQLKIIKSEKIYVAKFRQSYQSGLYKEQAMKALKLTKQNGRWKISKETTLSTL